ncbi:MAG: peptidase S10 [Leptothrix sp. (in: Bacteria)]|nr:peptidase S10 [Leptothrix sp. (in: b-proteobacteria)]
MADTAPSKPAPDADAAKRLKEQVDRLIARPAAESTASVVLGGRALDYRVHCAFMPVMPAGLAGGAAEPDAAVMTTAYLLQGADAASRPVCFAFNGGPGSASIWLQFGALGPKRVVVGDDGRMPVPPYAVEDNPHSWFEHFDLVFIDPPHTGWSVSASEDARKKLLSVDGDIDALVEVMRAWLTRHQRWGSPLYIAGESYGTTRAAGMADKMQSLGAVLSGVILVSCAMDLQSLVFAPANDLPYGLFLPAFANVSQYHGLLAGAPGASPEAARAAAEAFVHDDYVAALQAGARLGDKRRSAIARRIAELTGLPRTLVEEQNLRISDHTYFTEALRARGQVVGRLDARSRGPAAAARATQMEFDPGIEAIAGPYTMAALAFYRSTLGMDIEHRYEVLNRDAHKAWKWQRGTDNEMGFCSTSPDLALALRRNPHLEVLAASGRYDLGTPYSASDWSLAQLNAPADVLARVTHRYYDAGHMMYTRQADLQQLKADVAGWLS